MQACTYTRSHPHTTHGYAHTPAGLDNVASSLEDESIANSTHRAAAATSTPTTTSAGNMTGETHTQISGNGVQATRAPVHSHREPSTSPISLKASRVGVAKATLGSVVGALGGTLSDMVGVVEEYELVFTRPNVGVKFTALHSRALAVREGKDAVSVPDSTNWRQSRKPRPGALLVAVNGRRVAGGQVKVLMRALKTRFWSEENPLRLTFSEGPPPPPLSDEARDELDWNLQIDGWLMGEGTEVV